MCCKEGSKENGQLVLKDLNSKTAFREGFLKGRVLKGKLRERLWVPDQHVDLFPIASWLVLR